MFALKRSLVTMLRFDMILKCDGIHKSFLSAQITFVYHIGTASIFVVKLVIPFLQDFTANWTFDIDFGIVFGAEDICKSIPNQSG